MELAKIIADWVGEINKRIAVLESQNSELQTIIANMQRANNELADIAFDENRFTQQLLEKVDDTAREAVKESLDYDEIAREMTQYIDDMVDLDSLADRVLNNIDSARLAREVADTNTFSDKVDDTVERVLSDSNILNADEVDEAIGDYIERNYDMVQRGQLRDILDEEVPDIVHRLIGESLAGFQEELIKTIANRLGQTPAPTPSNGVATGVNFPQTSLQEGGGH